MQGIPLAYDFSISDPDSARLNWHVNTDQSVRGRHRWQRTYPLRYRYFTLPSVVTAPKIYIMLTLTTSCLDKSCNNSKLKHTIEGQLRDVSYKNRRQYIIMKPLRIIGRPRIEAWMCSPSWGLTLTRRFHAILFICGHRDFARSPRSDL